MDNSSYPRSLAHVAVAVPDIEEAIEWYQTVLGWTLLKPPRLVKGNEGYGGRRAVDLLGQFNEMKVAHLSTGNQIGVEFFEFSNTEELSEFDVTQPGFFHICVVDPDVEGLAKRIEDAGGEHHSQIWRLYENDEQYVLTYSKDPYGNLIEIYSHSHEQMIMDDS